jgi:hypothetical protein
VAYSVSAQLSPPSTEGKVSSGASSGWFRLAPWLVFARSAIGRVGPVFQRFLVRCTAVQRSNLVEIKPLQNQNVAQPGGAI